MFENNIDKKQKKQYNLYEHKFVKGEKYDYKFAHKKYRNNRRLRNKFK